MSEGCPSSRAPRTWPPFGSPSFEPPPPGVPQVARAVRWRWDPVRGPRCPSSRHPPTHWRTGRPRRERHRSRQNWFAPHPLLPQQAVWRQIGLQEATQGGAGAGPSPTRGREPIGRSLTKAPTATVYGFYPSPINTSPRLGTAYVGSSGSAVSPLTVT
ncbi:hypothetical protein MRX96_045829 [Rhipicephalus microplus]